MEATRLLERCRLIHDKNIPSFRWSIPGRGRLKTLEGFEATLTIPNSNKKKGRTLHIKNVRFPAKSLGRRKRYIAKVLMHTCALESAGNI